MQEATVDITVASCFDPLKDQFRSAVSQCCSCVTVGLWLYVFSSNVPLYSVSEVL